MTKVTFLSGCLSPCADLIIRGTKNSCPQDACSTSSTAAIPFQNNPSAPRSRQRPDTRGAQTVMSRYSFSFTPSALRSLRRDEDLLEQHRQRKLLAASQLSTYLLKKEARGSRPRVSPILCRDLVVHNALYTGDLEAVQRLFPCGTPVNIILESRGGDMRWVCRQEGLWSLTYEQELTTPLHITAGRGFADCLRHLLQRGADVSLAPGGNTALHEACDSAQAECVRLLLSYGANANAVSEEGLMPLHMCTCPESLQCAKYLLEFGALVNGRTLEEDDTPLHVAARCGLLEHTELYLRHGAQLERQNDAGQSPLNAACSESLSHRDLERYHRVCALLVESGACVHSQDSDNQTPLHMACKNINPDVVDLLLANGASVNDMCYGGNAPMHNILKGVAYKIDHQPERVVRSLLNHGSILVWPGALPKVLNHCCSSPRTIEVLLNAYDRLKITDSWREAIPVEVFQQYKDFYESLFALSQTPRTLQHLARCKIRFMLKGRAHRGAQSLGLPTFLQKYLLLDFRGYLH